MNVSTFHPREGKFPSDHYVIEFEIRHKFKRSKGTKRHVYDYKNGDLDALVTNPSSFLSIFSCTI